MCKFYARAIKNHFASYEMSKLCVVWICDMPLNPLQGVPPDNSC